MTTGVFYLGFSVPSHSGLEVIKHFYFTLHSAEHKMCSANESQITNNCKFFLVKHN